MAKVTSVYLREDLWKLAKEHSLNISAFLNQALEEYFFGTAKDIDAAMLRLRKLETDLKNLTEEFEKFRDELLRSYKRLQEIEQKKRKDMVAQWLNTYITALEQAQDLNDYRREKYKQWIEGDLKKLAEQRQEPYEELLEIAKTLPGIKRLWEGEQ